MQTLIKVGKRWYAVPKELGLAARIASRSNVRGNWQNIDSKSRKIRSHVILNQR